MEGEAMPAPAAVAAAATMRGRSRAVVVAVTGVEPGVNPLHSASDIKNPKLFSGIPSVGIGPLAGDLTQAGGHDEWVDVEDYIRTIKICAKIILDWSG